MLSLRGKKQSSKTNPSDVLHLNPVFWDLQLENVTFCVMIFNILAEVEELNSKKLDSKISVCKICKYKCSYYLVLLKE